MESAPTREKPIRVPLKQKIQESQKQTITTSNPIVSDGEVGEKIVVKPSRLIDDDSSGTDENGTTHTFTRVKLYDDSDDEDSELVQPKKKKSKKKTSSELKEITDTLGEITSTVTETFGDAGKKTVIEIIKTVIKSRQFTIVLFIATIFIGIGYLLKIVYK